MDCDNESQHQHATSNRHSHSSGGRNGGTSIGSGAHSRLSGPEEQWQEGLRSPYWTNPQLRLAMLNRSYSSTLAVFPYSESRPLPAHDDGLLSNVSAGDSRQEVENEEAESLLRGDHGGSVQSSLSRFNFCVFETVLIFFIILGLRSHI